MGAQTMDIQKVVRYTNGDILLIKFLNDQGKLGKEGDKRIAMVIDNGIVFDMYELLLCGDVTSHYLYCGYEFAVEHVYA